VEQTTTTDMIEASGRSGRRGRTARTGRRGLRAGLAAVALALVAATVLGSSGAPAGAGIYAGSGVWGYNQPAAVSCRYLDAWGQLRVEVPPPVAYAYNRYAGAGNDWQMVRYRLFYVDPRTGASLGSSGWSGLTWAGDTTAAAWSGTTMMSFGWRQHIQVHTRIEFYDRYGRYEGYTAHTANRYTLFHGYSYPGVGNLSWCAKVT
jgi:hypothetical protein